MTLLIQANNLHRYYANTHAVNNVSIELKQGEILGLLGPNGAGKSSCLQILCGALAPSSGEILINGFDLLESPNQAKQNLGYLPDIPPLYPELNVTEYLNYAGRLRRIKKNQLAEFRQLAIEQCGLQDVCSRIIGNLSKGFQQRVGIAQAIIHQPKIIVLDEPTVGLDPNQMREIRHLIINLGKEHGIILSTHILPEVQAVCNRVQLIHQGKSVFNQSMQSLKQSEQVIIKLKHSPKIDELLKLPSVEQAEQLDVSSYLLNGKELHLSLDKISQHCVNNNWGLLQINFHENSLDTIFLNLTSGEDTYNINEETTA